MNDIKLNKEEANIFSKWKISKYMSIMLSIVYFIFLYKYYAASFEGDRLFNVIIALVGLSFIFHMYAVKYENKFKEIVRGRIDSKPKHKMIQLMEEKKEREKKE